MNMRLIINIHKHFSYLNHIVNNDCNKYPTDPFTAHAEFRYVKHMVNRIVIFNIAKLLVDKSMYLFQ